VKRAGKGWVLALAASLLVAAAVIRGLVMIGPIEEQRARRFDERRLSDLRRIASSLDDYYRLHHELPDSLDRLAKQPGVRLSLIHISEPTRPY